MKAVKWLGICLLVFMSAIGFQSCSEDEYVSRLKELIIKDVTFEADDTEQDLFKTTTFRNEDVSNYQATADASWCTVEFDATLSQMTVTVQENTTNDKRVTTVTIVDVKQPSISRSFTVMQKQNNVVRTTKSSYTVVTAGGTFDIAVEHNVDDYTISCDVDWIEISSYNNTRGLETSYFTVNVQENESGAERRGIITIDSETTGLPVDVVVNQEYVFVPFFSLPVKTYTIDELGGTVTMSANTNLTQFDIYPTLEDTWASLADVQFPEKNVAKILFSISPFSKKEASRETTIKVYDSNVTITQVRNIFIEETAFTILQQDSKTLTLHNTNGEAVVWSSSDETVATVDENGTVYGVSDGTATITVASADGKHTDTVSVTIEKPKDLREMFTVEWQTTLEFIGGSPVIGSLSCKLTNNSAYAVQLTKCELFCDLKYVSAYNFDSQSGYLGSNGGSKQVSFSDLKDKGSLYGYTVVWYYTYNGESFTYRCEYDGK